MRTPAAWLITTTLAAGLVGPLSAGVGSPHQDPPAADTPGPMSMITRPDAEGVPTPVSVGVFVIDITHVDDQDQSFTADFVVRFQWRDPRLARPGVSGRRFAPEDVWTPDLLVLNRRRLFETLENTIRVDAEGTCVQRQRYYGQLSSPFDLRDFPLDTQKLSFALVSPSHGPDELELLIDETVMGRRDSFSLAGAKVGPGTAAVHPLHFAPDGRAMAGMTYSLDVERKAGYFLWKILVPLGIIVAMSWAIFWIDPKHVGPQISVSVTALLTMIAYRFLLANLLPRIGYLTRLDHFTLGSTLLVFLGLVVCVLTIHLVGRGREDLAGRIDRACRVLFPASFVLVVVFAFVL